MKELYLDNAATTPVFDSVIKITNKVMKEDYGNASSLNEKGEKARLIINEARKNIAAELGAKAEEIYFTSGATESNNMIIKGIIERNPKKNKIFVSAIEHSSIYECAKNAQCKLVLIPVNKEGEVDLKFLEDNVDDKTLLVSVMHVNNITGAVQNISAIGKICRKKGAIFHTDAVQSFGKQKIKVNEMNIDALSASAHKIGGPKGIGLLYLRNGINIQPLIFGGEQEKGIRAGTENVPGIAGFAAALKEIKNINWENIRKSRDELARHLKNYGIITQCKKQAPNFLHISTDLEREEMVLKLSRRKVYVSAGSACEQKNQSEDRVLKAMGYEKKYSYGAIRISLMQELSNKEISYISKCFLEIKNNSN